MSFFSTTTKSSDVTLPVSDTQETVTDAVVEGEQELDLTNPKDLRSFYESVEELYQAALSYESTAVADTYQKITAQPFTRPEDTQIPAGGSAKSFFKVVHDIYTQLNQALEPCRETDISDETYISIQILYSDLLSLSEYIAAVYTEEEVAAEEKSFETSWNADAEEGGDAAEIEPEQAEYDVPEVAPVPKVKIEELEIDTKVTLVALKQKVAQIQTQLQSVESTHTALQATFADTVHSESVQTVFAELQQTIKRRELLQQQVASALTRLSGTAEDMEAVDSFQQVVKEISKNTEEFVRALPRQVVTASAVVSQPVSTPMSEEQLPTKSEFEALQKRVSGNQFYTVVERLLAQQKQGAYEQAVAEQVSGAAVVQAFQEYAEFVTKLDSDPDVTQLAKRGQRIMDRIVAGATAHASLRSASTMLFEDLQTALNQKPINELEVVTAYKALESFAVQTQASWLAVCGYSLPSVGLTGIPMAVALRARLLKSHDKQDELRTSPVKQILIDKMVRLLAKIPPAGFTENDPALKELHVLAKEIDIYKSVVPMSEPSTVSQGAHTESRLGTTQVKMTSVQQPIRRKKMQVIPDSADGGVIQIQVPATVVVDTITYPHDIPAVAAAEKSDPINTIVPVKLNEVPRVRLPELVHADSLTRKYLLPQPEYRAFIEEHFSTPEAFEKFLQNAVAQQEAKSIDTFERWLGEVYASSFEYLQDMTVTEVQALNTQAFNVLKPQLVAENIKYEACIEWFNLLPLMTQGLQSSDLSHVSFGELFACWMIEKEMMSAEL